MKAAVFHKPGDISYDTVEDPRIENAGDVILRLGYMVFYLMKDLIDTDKR